MADEKTDGDVSWEAYRRYVLAELRRSFDNDEKMLDNFDKLGEKLEVLSAKSARTVDKAVSEISEKMDKQQQIIDDMRTKWAIITVVGIIVLFLIEHIGIPLLFPSLHR